MFWGSLRGKYNIDLDEQQQEAVKHFKGPALILAGPGSGKTTVITARLAYLILEMGIEPNNILTLTFNKAAQLEMERRFNTIYGSDVKGKVYFSTLHSFCNSVVRDYERRQGKKLTRIEGDNPNGENEEVCENKRIIIRNIYHQLNQSKINDEELENLINEIGLVKNKMIKDFEGVKFTTKNFSEIYNAYEEYKKSNLYMDFDDMLTYAFLILNRCPDILARYRNKYKYIQVDEGQDLSKIQFEILKLIVNTENCRQNNLFIVADDDQSIYGFRGAEPEHILSIEKQFQGCKLYKLENNYRSSKNIVNISSKFIKSNINRYDKNHKTENESGYDPFIINVKDERAQLDFIIAAVKEKQLRGNRSVGILYRNNLSSIAIVDALERNRINFKLKQNRLFFFKHWVVQDIMAFLKFSLDQTDVECFMRIYYKMNRYISKSMMETAISAKGVESVIDGILQSENLQPFQKQKFANLKIEFKTLRKKGPTFALQYIEEKFNYFDNVREYCENTGLCFDYFYNLFGILKTLSEEYPTIPPFLGRLYQLEMIFEKGNPRISSKKDAYVTLTTMHSSKGLEYDCVIMADLYNKDLPGQRSLDLAKDGNGSSLLEEERRLFYVGMTRAKQYLYLVSPQTKSGIIEQKTIFIKEVVNCINKKITDEIGDGSIVIHKKFGEGAIVAVYEQANNQTILEIDFSGRRRKLNLAFCLESGLLSLVL